MKNNNGFKEAQRHLSAGVNAMLPLLVIGGLFMAITKFMNPEGPVYEIFSFLSSVGLNKFDIFVAIAIASSITGKVGMAPAFIIGLYSNELGLGIFGGIVSGFLVGYLVKIFLKIKFNESSKAILSLTLIPFLTSIISIFIVHYVIAAPISLLSSSLTNFLNGLYGSNAMILGLILGAMFGFDLGGPINKLAGLFTITMLAQGVRGPITLALPAFMLPSVAAGLATFFDKKKTLFTDDERVAGKSSFLLGLLFLSEPALPFMFADPVYMVPVNVITSAILGGLYAYFGIESEVALGPILGFPYTNKPVLALGIFVGAVILLTVLILIRRIKLAKKTEE